MMDQAIRKDVLYCTSPPHMPDALPQGLNDAGKLRGMIHVLHDRNHRPA